MQKTSYGQVSAEYLFCLFGAVCCTVVLTRPDFLGWLDQSLRDLLRWGLLIGWPLPGFRL